MTDRTNRTQKTTAEDSYVKTHLLVRDLLERLGNQLEDMPAPGNDDRPIHWGHVGDINHVSALLLQAVNFLEGRG